LQAARHQALRQISAPEFLNVGATAVLAFTILITSIDPYVLLKDTEVGPFTSSTIMRIWIIATVVMYYLYRGIRVWPNVPLLLIPVLLVFNFLFSSPPYALTTSDMMKAAAQWILPFFFVHLIIRRRDRRILVVAICMIPLASVIIGAVAFAGGWHPLLELGYPSYWGWRVPGAGGAASLTIRAFLCFAIAFHEAVRTRRWYFDALGFACFGVVMLTGGRMGLAASILFVVVYALLSPKLREMLGRRGLGLMVGGAAAAALVTVYLPFLQARTFGADGSEAFNVSMRDELFAFYFGEFLRYPWFGQGIGADIVLGQQMWQNEWVFTPHNDYMRLLVTCGIVGFIAFAAAVAAALRFVLRMTRSEDRPFILSITVSVCMFALTDDFLGSLATVPLFAYMAIVLGRQRKSGARRFSEGAEPGRSRRKRGQGRLRQPRPSPSTSAGSGK
jgi:teichuronic acid biosynthesis protein TuaE